MDTYSGQNIHPWIYIIQAEYTTLDIYYPARIYVIVLFIHPPRPKKTPTCLKYHCTSLKVLIQVRKQIQK